MLIKRMFNGTIGTRTIGNISFLLFFLETPPELFYKKRYIYVHIIIRGQTFTPDVRFNAAVDPNESVVSLSKCLYRK